MSEDLRFKSFFWAGFECTYAKVARGKKLDLLKATKHDSWVARDYEMLKTLGIHTVREGLAWSRIDQGNKRYDFSRFEKMMRVAKETGVEQIWDLNHFDYPDYLDPFSDKFVKQFTEYAKRAHSVIRKYFDGTIYIAPVNEISFFAWISSDVGSWAPYKKGRDWGFRFKSQLVKCALSSMRAIWAVDRDVRFIHIDPFMRRVAREPVHQNATDHVNDFNNVVRFEAWDMIAGKTYPELGGEPKYLDIVGMNYYFHNQEWVWVDNNNYNNDKGQLRFNAMSWHDKGRVPFWHMVQDVYDRYKRPVVITETGSFGDLRFRWWKRTLQEVDDGLKNNIPIYGVCAYPVLDRPHRVGYLLPESGLWDFDQQNLTYERIPHTRSISVIKKYIQKWK